MSGANIDSQGWHIEIDYENGKTHLPNVRENVQYNPQEGGLPHIQVPVEKNDKWSDDGFDSAPMRVWHDGERMPIDLLEKVTQENGTTTLHGRGGGELERPVEVQVGTEQSHSLAERLIEENTGLTPHVDTPETTRQNDFLVTEASTQEDFQNAIDLSETHPLHAQYGGGLSVHESCKPSNVPGQELQADFVDEVSGNEYNGGTAYHLNGENNRVVFQINFDYDVPAEHVGIKVRDKVGDFTDFEFRWTGDGTDGAVFSNVAQLNKDLQWREVGSRAGWVGGQWYQNNIGKPIKAGENYFLGIVTTNQNADYILDSVAVYDTRWNYSWPNPGSENNGEYLAGPEKYPHRVEAFGKVSPLANAAVSARITSQWDHLDTAAGGAQRVGFSINNFEFSFTSQKNESSVDWGDFDTPTAELAPFFILSRRGSDDRQYPTQGFETHTIHSFKLYADIEDTPLTLNRDYNMSLRKILNDIASTDFLWELSYDDEDGMSIEWTRTGQRVRELGVDASEYELERNTSDVIQAVGVYGALLDYEDYFRSQYGQAVDLDNHRIQKQSETVVNPQTNETYRRGSDYSFDSQNGTITVKEDGNMDDTTRYIVRYKYNSYGEYELPGVENPKWLEPQDVPAIVSDAGCRQAARAIVDELSEPQYSATLTIPESRPGWSLVESIQLDDPLVEGRVLDPQEISISPGSTNANYGSRRGLNTVLEDITDQLKAVQRQS